MFSIRLKRTLAPFVKGSGDSDQMEYSLVFFDLNNLLSCLSHDCGLKTDALLLLIPGVIPDFDSAGVPRNC